MNGDHLGTDALFSLARTPQGDAHPHLSGCRHCSAEVETLRETLLGRSAGGEAGDREQGGRNGEDGEASHGWFFFFFPRLGSSLPGFLPGPRTLFISSSRRFSAPCMADSSSLMISRTPSMRAARFSASSI